MTATAVATLKKPSSFELELAEYEPQIAAALPAHISPERFKRVVVTAINQNPALYKADRRTLFTACVRAAQDGLLPDGREAALVIYRTKSKQTGEWKDAVQYLPMIAGIIKRMRNSGDVAAVDAQLVHQKDEFTYRLGDDPKIEHKPALADRGEPIAAYAIIKLTNGEVLREVMGRQDIEKVRSVSRAKDNGPWVDWWGEMARKTVLRRCAKRAPVSSDLDEMIRQGDEEAYGQRGPQHTVEIPMGRPTRAEFQEPRITAEPFVITTGDGSDLHYESATDAAAGMAEAIAAAAKISKDAVDGLWESNGFLLSQLRERDRGDLADTLGKTYVDTIAALSKPKAEEKKAEPQQDAVKPAAAAQPETAKPAAPSAGNKPVAPAAGEPPSPMKVRKAEWPAWVDWAIERINAMPRAEISVFLTETRKAEFDYISENRVPDWERIEMAIDQRRTDG